MKKGILLTLLPAMCLCSCAISSKGYFGKTFKFSSVGNSYDVKVDGKKISEYITEVFQYIDFDNFPGGLTFTESEKANAGSFMVALENKANEGSKNEYGDYSLIFSSKEEKKATLKQKEQIVGEYQVEELDPSGDSDLIDVKFSKNGSRVGESRPYAIVNNVIEKTTFQLDSILFPKLVFVVELKPQAPADEIDIPFILFWSQI